MLVLTGSYPTLFGRVIYMEWFFFALMTAGRVRAAPPRHLSAGLPDVGLSRRTDPLHPGVGGDRREPAAAQPADALFGAAVVATGWPVALWVTRPRG